MQSFRERPKSEPNDFERNNQNLGIWRIKKHPIAKSRGTTKNPSKIYLKSLNLCKSRLAKLIEQRGTTPTSPANFSAKIVGR